MNTNEPQFYLNLISTGANPTENVAPSLLNKMSNNINYRKLTKKLEDITGKQFPDCITHFKYLDTEEDHDRNENCLCGKEHLVVLNNFKCDIDNEIYIIGSNCIRHFVLVGKNTTTDNNVIRYLNNIETELDTGLRALEYNKCLSCNELKIKKGYEYKNKLHKVFCKECVSGERVKCCSCRKLFPIGLDYKGNHKTLCMGCWKRNRGYITTI